MNNLFYHLKIALRNLRSNGLYSGINVGGLAVSLAVCILIMLWIRDERSFDKFHKRHKDIYMTALDVKMGGVQQRWGVASAALGAAAKTEIPEIENVCRMNTYIWGLDYLKFDDHILSDVSCAAVDSSFFSIFDFPILKGDRRNLLPYGNSVVLSEHIAENLFGDRDPIGQTITDNNRKSWHVSGVISMPQNTSNRYDVLFNFRMEEVNRPKLNEEWNRFNYKTYFLLRPGADTEDIGRRLTSLHEANSQSKFVYTLHPLDEENLCDLYGNPNSKMQACRLFSIAVAVLLFIACINYINLVTARASRRDKEISVRKILGANKPALFSQFFNESLLLFFFSLVAAAGLIYLLFPAYNQIIGKQLVFRLFSVETLTSFAIVFAAVMLSAGIYPAANLSIRKNLQKITRRTGVNTSVRRILVVSQFVASVVLILGAVTMNRQMQFIKTKNPGYEKEQVFYVKTAGDMKLHTADIKSRLMQSPNIEGVTFMNQPLNKTTQFAGGINWPGSGEKKIRFNIMQTDADFIPLMSVQLTEGDNFSTSSSDGLRVIVNQKAVADMELEDPVGKRLNMGGESVPIIGVVEDFHFENMHEPIKPLIIKADLGSAQYMYVKIRASGVDEALKTTEKIFRSYNDETPFSYGFLDEEFGKIYQNDLRTGKLFFAFAVIAVIVSCLGLFGLVTYTAETKTKEIGIRKVLGASVVGIVRMLSKEFLILVGIAMLIAFPLAYLWLDKMLLEYAYRITVSWQLFVAAGLITVVLTLFTVGWQALKAATANPVKSIKTE